MSHRKRTPDHRATLLTIAEDLGISRTTVSNAYNRPDQLSEQLRTAILQRAKEIGYGGPNPTARSLRAGKARAVGLIFTERLGYAFRDPAAVEFLHGLAEACSERGKSLLMVAAGAATGERGRNLYRNDIMGAATSGFRFG